MPSTNSFGTLKPRFKRQLAVKRLYSEMRSKAMETNKRKQKPDGASNEQNEGKKNVRRKIEDKLSNLPGKLLQHILSFLDTRVAIQTSVLSKRWRYLWQGISTLHFNSHPFSSQVSFMRFVRHVLFHRDLSKSLREFSIYYRWSDSNLKEITDYLVSHSRDIQVLKFGAFDLNFLTPFLPLLFTWECLSFLKLEDLVIPYNLYFGFVSLATLHLKDCWLPWNKTDTCDPFKGCLKLKILQLNGCRIWQVVKTLEISAPELTDLKISWMECDELEPHYRIVLSSLKLKSFSFKGPKLFEFSIKCLPFLKKVNVHLGQKCPTEQFSSREEDHKYLIHSFRGVANAKFVTLSHATIHILSMVPDVLRGYQCPFNRVHYFKIEVRQRYPFSSTRPSFTIPAHVMRYLLTGSPSAKGITVVHSKVKQ